MNQAKFVLPENVEDEAIIDKLSLYKKNTLKLVFYYLTSVLTLGMVALLAKWKYNLRIAFKYSNSTPEQAEFAIIKGRDKTEEHIAIKKQGLYIKQDKREYQTFTYRLYNYYFDDESDHFKPIEPSFGKISYKQILEKMSQGLESREQYQRRIVTYGKNLTDIPRKSNFKIIYDEILSPFYIFQLFACILWSFENYLIYSSVIFVISVGTIILTFNTIKHNYTKLHKQAHFETDVKVFRSWLDGGSEIISSADLVPGDIIEIPGNQIAPCDIILLTGNAIMNESMLTGESIPIIKQPVPYNDKIFDPEEDSKHILFSGTKCLETRKGNRNENTVVKGVIMRTGFATMKGRLVRSLLFPKPENFQFYRDSMKFIAVMIGFATLAFLLTLHSMIKAEASTLDIIFKSLDIITIAVPPALATCMSIGAEIATERLENQQIITKSQNKINVAGRIDVMCFDKTGTLTEDSLDLYGVRATDTKAKKFDKIVQENIHSAYNGVSESKQSAAQPKLLELMATCHSLTYVQQVLQGDPLDLKMFNAVEWELTDHADHNSICSVTPKPTSIGAQFVSGQKIEVVKRFDFVPKLQRMSVITKDEKEDKQRVYVKGSPEKVRELCLASSIPSDFEKVLSVYTQSGLRVIACATRIVDDPVRVSDTVERDQYENNLEFIGLIIFQNKLKPATSSAIAKLKYAKIRSVMITGDNALTAVCVARDCGIVSREKNIILGELRQTSEDSPTKTVKFRNVELIDPDEKLLEQDQVINDMQKEDELDDDMQEEAKEEEKYQYSDIKKAKKDVEMMDLSNKKDNLKQGLVQNDDMLDKSVDERAEPQSPETLNSLYYDDDASVAITGDALTHLRKSEADAQLYKLILTKAKVFARMRPEEKALVVEELQEKGFMVGMCGDGANDCPALKVANVGVSLSEAEASIAAPFMSKITDISCIDIVLREGRAALMTSFQCFKYMAMYSVIQTVSISILYYRGTNLSDSAFLFVDLFVIIPLAVTMSYTGPHKILSHKQPISALVSVPILSSLLGQTIIQVLFQAAMVIFLVSQSFYKTPQQLHPGSNDEYELIFSYDSTTIFLFSNFQYIATVLAFSIGKPFRKEFYTNAKFTICVALCTVFSIFIILTTSPAVMSFIEVISIPQSFKEDILFFALGNFFLTIIFEKIFVPGLTRAIIACRKKRRARTV